VVFIFARLWPGKETPLATAALCVALAAGCAFAAKANEEPLTIKLFNRWSEAAIFLAIAGMAVIARRDLPV